MRHVICISVVRLLWSQFWSDFLVAHRECSPRPHPLRLAEHDLDNRQSRSDSVLWHEAFLSDAVEFIAMCFIRILFIFVTVWWVLVGLWTAEMPNLKVRKEQRVCLKFLVKQGKHPCECLQQLREVYGGDCLSKTQVHYWCKQFQGDDMTASTDDKPHPGWPRSKGTAENIAKVQKLISQSH